jgi:hypothetical protein
VGVDVGIVVVGTIVGAVWVPLDDLGTEPVGADVDTLVVVVALPGASASRQTVPGAAGLPSLAARQRVKTVLRLSADE